MAKVKLTLKEFLHYLNAMEEDVDVSVDGIDSIAVVGGDIKLTPEGMKEFGPALEMKMDYHCIEGTDEDYDKLDDDEGNLVLAWRFLRALAGYCPSSKYNKWFEGADAKLL